MLELAAEQLGELLCEVVFVGGARFLRSRDFGDVVVLIDGREELPGELVEAPEPLRDYLAAQLEGLSGHPVFDSWLEGALPSSPETRDRVDLVIRPRIAEIIAACRS